MQKAIKTVAVVGGGTAGWLSAAIIAAEHKSQQGGLKVILVESSDIPTVGVGEGTWPTMKNTLQQIGLREIDVFKACNASFKQGGKFVDWTYGSGDFYYHPFTVPLGYGRIDLAPYVNNVENFAQQSNFQHEVCEASLAPRNIAQGEYQGSCNYAYHLDAGAFANLLKQHCKEALLVEHVVGTVKEVQLDNSGAINSLILQDTDTLIEADLYIDCTGFSALLLGQALKIPFKKMDHVLFNDSALAMQVPYDENQPLLASHTIATAQNTGWIWDIGLTHRRGVGHVYSSKFISDEEAEINLRRYLGDAAKGLTARKITFESGYREKFWHKNCVAIGMAAGFVEPLEATAIMLVEISARFVAEQMPTNTQVMPIIAKRFNNQMDYRWQRIIDFLKLHYMLTKRKEPYWLAHTQPNSIPQSLQEDLLLWSTRGPQIQDFQGPLELFPAASYQYVLYGMGFQPDFSQHAYLYQQHAQAQQIIERNSQLTEQMLQTLPPHRAFIEQWLATQSV
ncbi:tryptophan 7-halogenase [Pseudoalteromonas sp. MMG010]|uniref:tryptophan halogenase family protein n=1 Tax=Pseudoalteromonas sp. MMG010 TaxID=2822685 RepID=UPI001B3A4A3A|nr:tryptophan halogenase family protein [Pseudoalteromonas sp. MMG010]MBQ4832599.1 tryptophan 7-halogenase [Pseudoalteromonas sp. MMG010]